MEPASSKPPEARMLSDSDIVKVSGVPDLKIIRYPELAQLATWSDLTNNSGTAAAVLYLTEDANTGHWIAAFNGPNDTAVVFDPLGMALDSEGTMLSPEKRAALGQNTKQFARLLVTAEKEGKKPSVNHTDFQEFAPNVNTCGRWVALRIRHRDKDSKAFHAFVADAMRQAGTKDADEWVASVTGGAMVGSGLVGGVSESKTGSGPGGVAGTKRRREPAQRRVTGTQLAHAVEVTQPMERAEYAEYRRATNVPGADVSVRNVRKNMHELNTILAAMYAMYPWTPTTTHVLPDNWIGDWIWEHRGPGDVVLRDEDDEDDADEPPPPPPGAGVSESKSGSGFLARLVGAGKLTDASARANAPRPPRHRPNVYGADQENVDPSQPPAEPPSTIDMAIERYLAAQDAWRAAGRPSTGPVADEYFDASDAYQALRDAIDARGSGFLASDKKNATGTARGESGLVGAGKRKRAELGQLSANIEHPHDDVERLFVEGRTEAEQRGFTALRRAMHNLGAFIDTLPAGDEKRLISQWFTDVEEDSYTVPDAVDDFRTLRISEQTKRAMQPLIQRLIEADELLQTAFEEAEDILGFLDDPDDEPEAELENEGAGFFDTLANGVKGVAERVSGFVRGARLNYSPSADKVLQAHQPWTITNLRLYRVPVQKPINTALNVVSLGRFGAAKKEAGIDTLYHLMLLVNVQSPDGANTALLRVEKNAVINIDQVSEMTGGQEQAVPLPQPTSTFQTFMDKGRAAMGEKTFFLYDAFKNNCQDFVRGLLRANGVLTPEADAFLKQDVTKIQEKSGSFTHKVANFVTNLGARADRALQGGGRRIFGEMHLNQPGYNTYVTTSDPGGLLRPTSEDVPDILARIAGMVEADRQEVYRLKAEVTEEASAYPPATQTAVADIIRQSTRAIRNVRTNTDKNVDLAAVQLELADDIHFLRVASSLKDMINAFVEQLVNYVNSTRLLARTERQLPQDVISERSEVVYERDHPENDTEAPPPPPSSDAPATSENGLAGMGMCSDDVYVSDSDESCCPVSWGEQLANHIQGRS